MLNFKKNAILQRLFRTRAEDTLPHRVTHQRIYIVPSKRGFGFLLTLLLMLIASINYSLSLGYALCFLLTGLFSATLLHTYRNLAGIDVHGMSAQNSFAGESVVFDVSLVNSHNRPRHGIQVGTQKSVETIVRLEPDDQSVARLVITGQPRGRCLLGRLTLRSDWPLGLWTCWSYLHVPQQALVFPAPEKQAPPLPDVRGNDAGLLSDKAIQGDVSGLRDYQPGDSIGSIAWKSTARGLGLQTRTFDSEASCAQTVIDLKLTEVPGLEDKLSRMCAWVLHAEQQHTDYALRLADFSLDKGRGKEQQLRALTALAMYDGARGKIMDELQGEFQGEFQSKAA